MAGPILDDAAKRLIAEARRAVLTTLDARDGRPRSVPICFVALAAPAPEISGAAPELTIYSPLDEKPKAASDPHGLRRVRNLDADPRATILVDRWDEDWTQLAFVELGCLGSLVEPGGDDHRRAIEALRAKYPQYVAHDLESRPMLRFGVMSVATWNARLGG